MNEPIEIISGYPIDEFLMKGSDKPLEENTQRSYRRALRELQSFVRENGNPTTQLLVRWQQELRQKGYHDRSINLHITAANGYFRWCGRPDLVMRHTKVNTLPHSPELTRAEYRRLLCMARTMRRHRLYLIIKLFATTGLPLQCLEQITVEFVQRGGGWLNSRENVLEIHLPEHFRQELLDYVSEAQIGQGPIFVTRSGKPLDRSNLFKEMRDLCRLAGVPEEKGNPRALHNLYQSTQSEVSGQMEQLLLKAYDQLLQAEQITVGWKEGQEINAG